MGSNRRYAAILIFLFLGICAQGFAGEKKEAKVAPTLLDFPLVDAPINFLHGYRLPSMVQSQAITKDFYQTAHYALMNTVGAKYPWLGMTSVAVFDLASYLFPPGSLWMHDQWHRAVLDRYGISSSWAANNITDQDLATLKQHHPADFVRLQSAGIEAQNELNLSVEKEKFFSGETNFDIPMLWFNYFQSSIYLFNCASTRADDWVNQANAEEGADISKRDFAGLDCTGWTYDLFRPDEAYSARGMHPSGVGINRYRKWSDLGPDEQSYLSKQTWLSLLNFVDPNLLGIVSFDGRNPFNGNVINWNASLRHHLTSFGITIDANLFVKEAEKGLMIIFHQYFNKGQYFPGLETELVRYPISLFSEKEWLSARVMAWLQPKDQRFDSTAATPGALLSVKLSHEVFHTIEAYAEIEGKSEGWVAGNVFVDPAFSLRFGMLAKAF